MGLCKPNVYLLSQFLAWQFSSLQSYLKKDRKIPETINILEVLRKLIEGRQAFPMPDLLSI